MTQANSLLFFFFKKKVEKKEMKERKGTFMDNKEPWKNLIEELQNKVEEISQKTIQKDKR